MNRTTENNTIVIGLTGAARSGKDTAARLIHQYVNEYNDNQPEFTEYYVMGYESFAGPLKSMVAMLLDFFGLGEISKPETLVEYIDGNKKEDDIEAIGASPRKLMQTLGTQWGRNTINPEIWINSMLARLANYKTAKDMGYKGSVVVITDVRFDNEAEVLKELGATIVRITKPDVQQVRSHESEGGIFGGLVDRTVVNDGTIEQFKDRLYAALKGVLPEYKKPLWDEETNDDRVDEERFASHT